MSAEPNLTDRDTEQLSAYIDGALDDSERAALEARLQTDAALRRELDALRHTVALVRDLPRLKAPRDFTLTPAMLEGARTAAPPPITPIPRRVIRFPAVSLMSAAASMVMIFLGVLLLLGDTPPETTPAMVEAPAPLASPDAVAVAATKTAVVAEEALVEALDAPEVETFAEALEAAAEIVDDADFVGEPEALSLPGAAPDFAPDEEDPDAAAAAGTMALQLPAPADDDAPVEAPVPEAEPPTIARQALPEDDMALEEAVEMAAENEAVDETPEAEPALDLLSEVIVDPADTVSRDVLGGALVLAGLGLLALVVYFTIRRRSPPHDR